MAMIIIMSQQTIMHDRAPHSRSRMMLINIA